MCPLLLYERVFKCTDKIKSLTRLEGEKPSFFTFGLQSAYWGCYTLSGKQDITRFVVQKRFVYLG